MSSPGAAPGTRQRGAVSLAAPVGSLSGVGPHVQSRIERLGVRRVLDLLFHLPYRYQDRTTVVPLGALRPGQEALVQGCIELAQMRYGRRRSLLCRITDGTGALVLRFFHFRKTQQESLQQGVWLRCWGQARRGQHTLEMVHPEYRQVAEHELETVEQTLTPVYPSTEGVAQGKLRRLIGTALDALDRDPAGLEELIPARLLEGLRLPTLQQALVYVHRPPPDADTGTLLAGTHPAQQRLAFEELLAHQVSLRQLRAQVRTHKAPALHPADNAAIDAFITGLPFRLTAAQQRVFAEVRRDLERDVPMLRLLQGDVGSGKTVISALAAIQAMHSGHQVAMMAPTELLAEQHYLNFSQWLPDPRSGVLQLTGRLGRGERRRALERLLETEPVIAIGTHALFQEDVHFHRLGLVIIDEQHRFGVHQRLALLEKGAGDGVHPHQLVMTATPIPRTLAMTLFADLDVSVIDELPPGRSPVRTAVVSSERRHEVIDRITHVCGDGRQVYWVCPLIEESEALQCQAAVETRQVLAEQLPALRVGLVHGRMGSREKEEVMGAFKAGELNLLVATTVIEVGVDVPNASLMVIENAERLGLAQLHQLRGRVGRGQHDSDCVLVYQPPLGETARERLETMRGTTDGFVIAEKDLELRGPGELLGSRQTGLQNLRIASLVRDARLVPPVQRAADSLIRHHPENIEPLVRRWITADDNLGSV